MEIQIKYLLRRCSLHTVRRGSGKRRRAN